MRIHVKSFRSQAGGSTLIGLVLGVCTGILMLIKWPELADYIEPHVQQFLAADLDSVASSIVESTQNLADESPGQLDNSTLTGLNLSVALTRLVILCHRNLSVLCLLIALSRHKNF